MIPIRNVYYMLAYAWNHLQESRTIDLSGVDAQTPEDLLALVLARGTLRLLKRGVGTGTT
jgi:5-methylcytosine-specific restriction enzyme subunit McrC